VRLQVFFSMRNSQVYISYIQSVLIDNLPLISKSICNVLMRDNVPVEGWLVEKCISLINKQSINEKEPTDQHEQKTRQHSKHNSDVLATRSRSRLSPGNTERLMLRGEKRTTFRRIATMQWAVEIVLAFLEPH